MDKKRDKGGHQARAREAQLLQLGDALQAAAAQADWDRLGTQVRALGPLLQALAAAGPWSAAERAALLRLRSLHDAAAASAATAARALDARLREMSANKDGWIAYAMHSETEQGASQE